MTQYKSILRNIRFLPMAIMNRHYDMIDKLIQWMLIPRMLLMAVIIFMGIVVPFIYLTAALKWWGLFAIVILIFAIATPNYLVDDKWDSTFFKMPFIILSSILKKFNWGKKLIAFINLKT